MSRPQVVVSEAVSEAEEEQETAAALSTWTRRCTANREAGHTRDEASPLPGPACIGVSLGFPLLTSPIARWRIQACRNRTACTLRNCCVPRGRVDRGDQPPRCRSAGTEMMRCCKRQHGNARSLPAGRWLQSQRSRAHTCACHRRARPPGAYYVCPAAGWCRRYRGPDLLLTIRLTIIYISYKI